MLEDISRRLADSLQERILTKFGHAVDRVVLQAPPRIAMGDLATPIALELARALKRPPRQIAEELLKGFDLPPLVRSASVEGAGYLNFRLDRGAVMSSALREGFAAPVPAGEKILVEHTNINPNKAAHIGHLRNAVLGDTLVRSLKWLGYQVETQNYIDDTGVQVADVVVGFQRLLGESVAAVKARAERSDERFDFFCWDLYSRMASYYEEHPEAKEWRRQTLHDIEQQSGDTAAVAAIVAQAVVRRHLATMLRLDIEYDVLTKESDIILLRFWDRAFQLLKDSGAAVLETAGKHKDCWVMQLSTTAEFEGLEEPDKVLVRSNGTVTYVGKDIAYQLWKFGLLERTFGYRRFVTYEDGRPLWETTSDPAQSDASAPRFGGAKRVYNVIDTRQAYLQKVVKEGLRLLGHPEAADNSVHFSYEMVALTPATAIALGMKISDEDASKAYLEMSGRKGLGVKADDLLDALESKASEVVRQGLAADQTMTDEQNLVLARQIAIGSLRYFMLKYGRTKVIAFDFAEALTFEGDSGPYLQYSTVRAKNIFRKLEERGISISIDADSLDTVSLASDVPDEIWEIVRSSEDTAGAVLRGVETLEMAVLTRHALDLAQKFNSFYHRFSILNESDPAERLRRAACATIFLRTMEGLLGLMGIPLPSRM